MSTQNHRATSARPPSQQPLCVQCQRALARSYALARDGALQEVCEPCYLLESLRTQRAEFNYVEELREVLRELREIYHIVAALRTTR